MMSNVLFAGVMVAAIGLFARNINRLMRNIRLGREQHINDRRPERWMVMAKVALGQSKMVVRPVAGFMHILIYAGFVIINIEVLEIIIDGLFGTHRIGAFLGPLYDLLIGSFEWLAVGVLLACVVFIARRAVLQLPRFHKPEMKGWPSKDAMIILVVEILLMNAFLLMNAADVTLQSLGAEHYVKAGAFPVSSGMASVLGLSSWSEGSLIALERGMWWFHIIGILAFLNYLPYSKHLHILLAFPNTWYSKLAPRTEMGNMPRITGEVRSMMDPSVPPPEPAPARTVAGVEVPERFGAKDVFDLGWKSLLDAYSCTECGRCTSECPANLTGKLLSPRKIMMDTRDRVEEIGRNIDANGGVFKDDGKDLHSRITEEELWACTTCNACTQACPVNIDPVHIIMEMRRYKVMEESSTRPALTSMFNNVENNGAPWAFGQDRRMEWAQDA
jgi:heterodisulfide reductase subunit C